MNVLAESRDRLKALGVAVAITVDGDHRLVANKEVPPAGFVVWTPEDIYRYLEMPRSERDVFRGIKMKFNGRVEWV